jgi:hypothetical protein
LNQGKKPLSILCPVTFSNNSIVPLPDPGAYLPLALSIADASMTAFFARGTAGMG